MQLSVLGVPPLNANDLSGDNSNSEGSQSLRPNIPPLDPDRLLSEKSTNKKENISLLSNHQDAAENVVKYIEQLNVSDTFGAAVGADEIKMDETKSVEGTTGYTFCRTGTQSLNFLADI